MQTPKIDNSNYTQIHFESLDWLAMYLFILPVWSFFMTRIICTSPDWAMKIGGIFGLFFVDGIILFLSYFILKKNIDLYFGVQKQVQLENRRPLGDEFDDIF
ncbi:MAG: hypothetical protein LBU65_14405 [Planctomycetaceae bacterium]|jgi:hypothetical protein|nr:hypothetical protein [Planctomycetaceae bacterium]